MNPLTVRNRKFVYFAALAVLFIPIILLGAPAGPGSQKAFTSFLAQSRADHELGEASLGDVDPTSATMNLVLLGMRGVAASVLWNQAEEYKSKKNFAELQQTVESIILLQPHFKAVWQFQAWNLGFNVSAEFDAVEDRFFWVKRGAKFMRRGVDRNQRVPELKFDMGRFLGEKIGNSDEKEVFRKFFLHDPDEERWHGGADEDINPAPARDNYLVARDWYFDANRTLEQKGVEQHATDQSLFIAYPYRSLMDYARAMQREGVQVDLMQLSAEERDAAYQAWMQLAQSTWRQAHDEWVNRYGHEPIQTTGGGTIVLDDGERAMDELKHYAEEEGFTMEDKLRWQDQYCKISAYPYWKRHTEIEQLDEMVQARALLAEGRRLYSEVQDLEAARDHLYRGMTKLQEVIDRYQIDEDRNLIVSDEEDIIEDGMKAILIWQQSLILLEEPIPETFPLQKIWNDPNLSRQRADLTERFRRWAGGLR